MQCPCLARIVLVLSLAAFYACVEAPSPICPTCGPASDSGLLTDAGAEDASGADSGLPPCRVNADCGEGRICTDGRCVDCRNDSQCAAGQICVEEECVQGCRSNFPRSCEDPDDCPDEHCSPARPICTNRGPNGGTCRQCSSDNHCVDYGFGNTCVDNECTSTCDSNRPCVDGVCDQASGQCVECLEDANCGASGLICEARQCVQGCRDDSGCGQAQICTDNACVSGCRNDQGCGDGQLCLEGQCERGDCRGLGDCDPGERCVNNFCGSPCGRDADCGVGAICQNNNCQPGCHGDDDQET